MSDWDALLAFDREHVWHPYGALPGAQAPLPVVAAEGVRLKLADGRELIDGMSSWWCAIHGYRHPALDAAVEEQLGRMAHVMFGGLTHEPALRLAERLVEITPDGLDRVFFSDSGSVSVEVAIKLCLQFQRAIGHPERTRLLTVRGGYHGDTFGAMAVCDPVGGMHSMFTGVLPEHVFAERPPDGFDAGLDAGWAEHVGELVARHAHELAAVIVEPVVQGAGGMRFHAPECVALLRRLCDEHGLLLVLDEIATGFGRTGGGAVRLRARRRGARCDVRRQGSHRRLSHARRDALHARGVRCGLRRRGRRADAWADVHGKSARVRGRARVAGPARRWWLARARCHDRSCAARRARAGSGAGRRR